MKENAQQLFWVADRGVMILLPPLATRKIGHSAVNNEQIEPIEVERLRIIATDSTLKSRYETPEDGHRFMQSVSYERREKLFLEAQQMTQAIIKSWGEINADKKITVVLFGSIAKGLVKDCNHPDPSNIDLVAISDFTEDERTELFDKIRKKREEIQKHNLEDCPKIETNDKNPGNVGVHIQNISKVKNGEFGPALNYIGSSAFALYNEHLWTEIEQEALEFSRKKQEVVQRRRHSLNVFKSSTRRQEVVLFQR